MSDNNVEENVNEVVQEDVEENIPDIVQEVENKSDMPPKKEEPTITNPEPVDTSATSSKVNKKLSAMSKNTKEKQKNRRLPKPTTVSRGNSKGFSLDINPMYLFGLLGVIIAAASLWYQRKSYLKEEESDSGDSGPVQSTGGKEDSTPKSPPKKKQHSDPWAYQREHQQTGVFPGNYDFD